MPSYGEVNGLWPEGPLPVPSGAEAIAGARLLIREGFRFHGKDKRWIMQKRQFKLTSGNRRRTWPRNGVWYVNPDEKYDHGGGWRAIIHNISHYVHWRVMPHMGGHEFHSMTEAHLIRFALERGFLEGRLKRPEKEKPPRDRKAERHAAAVLRLKRWETKAKRADTAIKKLRATVRRYEREAA